MVPISGRTINLCFLANAASVHTQRWARYFASRGYLVSVVTFDDHQIEGVTVIRVPPLTKNHRLNTLMSLPRIRRIVSDIGPDILHAHYATSYGLASAFVGHHPLVVTAWGSDVLIMPEESWVYRRLVSHVLGKADLVTSMADHMTERIIARGYASAEKVITLPFGVDVDVFNPSQRTSDNTNESPVVVSTRRLDSGLDVHLLINAIPLVLASHPEARFVIAGDGPLRWELEQLAESMGIMNQVDFLGDVSHRDMPKLLGRADVFVSTARSDGNNVSLNEAMACGAFPVATDISANRQWISSGNNGLLFPCHDVQALAEAIISALDDPLWRKRVMSSNWEIVRTKASWAASMSTMEECYQHLLSNDYSRSATLRGSVPSE